MVKFYTTQIALGKITISDVPAKWKAAVQTAIKSAASKR